MAGVLVGLDAAHIRWHQFNGPATEQNGIALCVMHHKLFDFGAFTIREGRLRVSSKAKGTSGFKEHLLDYVSVSRGKLSATVYTDSKKDLLNQWGKEDNRFLAHDLLRRKRFAAPMRAFIGRMVEATVQRHVEHTQERKAQHER